MDAGHFDDLTRALAEGAVARRGALRLLTGGVLGVFGLLGSRGGNEAAAHNAIRKCKKIKDKKKRKKCLKKAKKHNAAHAAEETQPECTTHADCDNDLFCNGVETCGADGKCQPGTPPSCNDGIACTVDTCDQGANACLHTPDDGQCGANAFCDLEQGCVCESGFDPCGDACAQLGASCSTGQPGICASGTLVCNGTEVVCQRNQEPTAETCNGLDDDCDGQVDEGTCPAGQVCVPLQGGCRCTGGVTTCGDQCCPVQSSVSCGTTGQCAGSSTCQFYGSEIVCQPATCEGPTGRRAQRHCNGSGGCAPGAFQDCAPYICEAGACRNPCGNDIHCISSHYCATGSCVPRQGNGASCDRDRQCSSNVCEDGFCCTSRCAGGRICSETGTCACDPFVRCGTQCACVEGQCNLQTGICF